MLNDELTKQNDLPGVAELAFDARAFLNEELSKRCKLNPRYSLRAFARALGLTPAGLSLILSGKRGVTPTTAESIADHLGLDPVLREKFLEGIRRSKKQKKLARKSQRTPEFSKPQNDSHYHQLTLDTFSLISDWQHYAILSLIETKGFKPRISWVASRLGISATEAKSAVERLKRLKILDTSQAPWKQMGGPLKIENTTALSAARRQQKQVLEKALYSLENDSFESRDISSMTMAIDPKLVPLARDEIKKFRRYLMNLLESKGNQEEVYHLGIQIYPVSKNKKLHKEKL